MKILIAEDDPATSSLLQALLTEWGYEVVVARDGRQALELLSDDPTCWLALLDWMIPSLSGPEVCRELRSRGTQPYVYVILLTVRSETGDLVAGLEAGADDYLVKPVDPLELRARLRAARRILDLQSQLIDARESMRHQATHDSLTGLYNHVAIREQLEWQLAGEHDDRPFGIILVDVDHFKNINDQHGHLVGDVVLREIGARLCDSLRPYDAVGRYGGEEFLVILPGCDLETTAKLAERLRERIASADIELIEGRVPVTISLGVAARRPGDPKDARLLLSAADTALTRSKQQGRNRVTLATPS
jgi:diguanylate cyclase (GGDEF)-like protein